MALTVEGQVAGAYEKAVARAEEDVAGEKCVGRDGTSAGICSVDG